MFLPTLFFPSYIPPAFRVSFLGASEAARDLRVSRRLLTGTQRLNFRCNWLTAITFHQFGWESLSIKYLRVARRSLYMDRDLGSFLLFHYTRRAPSYRFFVFFAFYRSSIVNNSYSFLERTYFTSFPENHLTKPYAAKISKASNKNFLHIIYINFLMSVIV